MLIAEYLRAAATMRYTGDPISVHQLIADVEPRLQPLGYKRNGFADECFDKSLGGGTSVADVLKLLSEVGDFVRIEGGGHYPAETRRVQIDSALWLIASGLPTSTLASRTRLNHAAVSLGRMTRILPTEIPEQSVESWLDIPTLDFADFAAELLNRRGKPHRENAQDWQFYDASRKYKSWQGLSEQSGHDVKVLCRFKPEGIATYHYGIADLIRTSQNVICQRLNDLTFSESRRLIYGLHLRSGVFRNLPFESSGEWWRISLTAYESNEIVKFFEAICADFQFAEDGRKTFIVSKTLESSIKVFLPRFGIEPVFKNEQRL